jgi:Putative cyclase
MTRTAYGLVAVALFVATSAIAQTPSWTPPPDSARCPSKWGAGDERGSSNHMKPQSVLNAAKLIKTGEVIELSHVLNAAMPISRTRRFEMFTKRTTEHLGSNRRGSNEELVVSEIGQVGTQFDGFAHQTYEGSLYNCFKMDDVATRSGFTKLGIQNVGPLITRGLMIDVAGYKGVDMLGDTYEITVADLEGALKKQNMTLQPGDAVIINTGWGKLWGKDNARYTKSNPGIGVKAGEWRDGSNCGVPVVTSRTRNSLAWASVTPDKPRKRGNRLVPHLCVGISG